MTRGRREIAIIAGLCIGLNGLVVALATATVAGPIEADLTRRTTAALASAGMGAIDVTFTGRDAALTGWAEQGAARDAGDLVRTVEGVRAVTSSIKPAPPPSTTPTTSAPVATTTTTIAVSTADFALSTANGTVQLTGVVPSAEVAAAILSAAIETFGNDRVRSDLRIDPAAGDADWLGGIPTAIAGFALAADTGLIVAPPVITVFGTVDTEAERSALLAAVGATGLTVRDQTSLAPLTTDQAAQLEASLNASLANGTVLFRSGSTEITQAGAAALDEVASLLRAVPGAVIEVGGHTDSVGPPDENLALSQARAEAVVAHLVGAGVDRATLRAVGYGDTRPIATNLTEAGRTANRRTEFTVEGSAT